MVDSDGPALKDVVRQAIAAFNTGDIAAYFALHTPNTAVAESGDATYRPASEYRDRITAFRRRHPRAQVEIERLIAEPPIVVMESRFSLDDSDAETEHREVVVFDFELTKIARTTVYSSASLILSEALNEGV